MSARYTKEEIIKMLQGLYEKHGEPITYSVVYEEDSLPSLNVFNRIFGSWQKACEFANIPYGIKQKKVNKNRSNETKVGEEKYTKFGTLAKIIEYKNYCNIIIEFQDKYRVKIHTGYRNWERNEFKNPYDKSVLGVACIGLAKGSENGKIKKSYKVWYAMLNRCYNEKFHKIEESYKNCSVCDEWLCYENFEKWFNNNYYEIDNEKMHLDKDILVKRNKIYSPETCVFVPHVINGLFVKSDKARGDLPIGVSYNRNRNNYIAQCSKITKGKNRKLGYFKNPDKAFKAYKKDKEKYIKEIANEYKGRIPESLYIALINYKVEKGD